MAQAHSNRKILVLPGDGIGPEIMREVMRVMEFFDQRRIASFEVSEGLVGGSACDADGVPLTDATLARAQASDAVLFGSVGGPKWETLPFELQPERGLLKLRKEMDLFANLRPAQVFEALADASSLKRELVAGLDLLIVRELTGGIYFGDPRGIETLPDGTVVTKDDGPRAGTTLEGLAKLKPVFREGGTVTAGNACPLNDGAAAVIVMSDTKAKALGITPLARIVASGVTGLNPEIMGLGPVDACRQTLERAKMTIDDIDLVEINEAFAAQAIPSAKHLSISWDKLNVKGGAIALGHPFGQTGARIMTTLLNALEDTGNTFGLESMCVGGGQGMAMIVERLS